MHQPLVTVICLCYNHERFIREAVESVIVQTYPSIQIIIADDASTDGSRDVILGLKEMYPGLELCLLQENVGNCKAFNIALTRARGSFIIDFATDDIMSSERIEKQVKYFEHADTEVGVLFSDAIYIDESGKYIRNHFEHLFKHGLINQVPQGDVYAEVLRRYFIPGPTMMVKKAVFDFLGGYDESLSYEDFDFWVRSSRQFKYAFIDEKLTLIRKLAKSMSTTSYVPGDRQLMSTYKVCVRASKLNKNQHEHHALTKRVRYELRQSVMTGNHTEAKYFYKLLQTLGGDRAIDRLVIESDKFNLPLKQLRSFYYRYRFGQR